MAVHTYVWRRQAQQEFPEHTEPPYDKVGTRIVRHFVGCGRSR